MAVDTMQLCKAIQWAKPLLVFVICKYFCGTIEFVCRPVVELPYSTKIFSPAGSLLSRLQPNESAGEKTIISRMPQ
jgi:hypothetical protein